MSANPGINCKTWPHLPQAAAVYSKHASGARHGSSARQAAPSQPACRSDRRRRGRGFGCVRGSCAGSGGGSSWRAAAATCWLAGSCLPVPAERRCCPLACVGPPIAAAARDKGLRRVSCSPTRRCPPQLSAAFAPRGPRSHRCPLPGAADADRAPRSVVRCVRPVMIPGGTVPEASLTG